MSGPGEEYTDDDINDVYEAIADAMAEDAPDDATITVTAQIEWAGEIANNGRNGMRTTTFDQRLNIRPVKAALARTQQLEVAAARGPKSSYRAKSAQAQLKQLQKTAAGREALAAAGFAPSRETLRRYGHGTQAPSKANREKIAEAYENTRNPGRGVMGARRATVNALTEAMRALPGESTVRFRDIRDFRIE